jgi:DNA-binding GntR family transcriptional regulator
MAKAAELGIMPTTITAAVTNRLRDEILGGQLPPGSRLRQAHIAESYGVSTTPVREAFAALQREGLIQGNAHRGVIVFEPSATDLHEFYEIRIPLEALATEKATSNLTDRELEKIGSLLTRLESANKKSDWKLSGELNDEFHLAIYSAAQRPRLLQLIAELRASSRAYIAIFPKLVDRLEEAAHEHQAIYEACLARKPREAGEAMVNHLQHTVDVVAESIGEGDLKQ